MKLFSYFRTRILLIISFVVAISQISAFVLFDRALNQAQAHILNDSLETTARIFHRQLEIRFDDLLEKAQLIAADYAFKSALSTRNAATIQSVLDNHRFRAQADLMAIFQPEQDLLQSPPDIADNALYGALQPFLNDLASGENSIFTIVVIDGKFYQIALVRVDAPEPLGYFVLGFQINDAFAKAVGDLTLTDVSVLASSYDFSFPDHAGKDLNLVTSTHPVMQQESLLTQLRQHTAINAVFRMNINGQTFITFVIPVRYYRSNVNIAILLQRSWDDIIQPYEHYRLTLLWICSFLFALSLALSLYLGRKISKPVEALTKAIHAVEEGNYYYRIKVSQVDELGRLAKGFNAMISGLAERERMKFLAHHDSLTGLPNRRYFLKYIQQALEHHKSGNESSAILIIDLDSFKPVNDSYGHAAGDTVLTVIAHRLKRCTPRDEDLVARFGGDEFAIIYTTIKSMEKAEEKAHKILACLQEPITLEENTVTISGSIGICMSHPGMSIKQWLEEADAACYEAKDAGKGVYRVANPREQDLKN